MSEESKNEQKPNPEQKKSDVPRIDPVDRGIIIISEEEAAKLREKNNLGY